ncbi:hypothetical protein Sste5346_006805 [Sporothrix stenoceras]|uniref:Uncharacterized protein n=1 Tax=Sporothrix stenoceras TaxID=5173 RepID=A0ABR3YYB9_9PEZI
MALKGTRDADHAGSWYTADEAELSDELDGWLDGVPATVDGNSLPIPGARAVIAPSLDLRQAKRVFVLGPSHTYYLRGCALTTFDKFATPFGDFQVDAAVLAELRSTGKFNDIPRHNDVREHSLEMHLPYIWKVLERTVGNNRTWPTLVPIMVGDGDGVAEKAYGELLLPYLEDPDNAFVVSSDFCHWGRNFQFWQYSPDADFTKIRSLPSRAGSRPASSEPPIHEFIHTLDKAAFDVIETGVQADFVQYLHLTENTICGRHPISVVMAALELLAAKTPPTATAAGKGRQKFAFVKYDRSELARTTSDSSVSYASAYAIF